jgi:hypothetical protein
MAFLVIDLEDGVRGGSDAFFSSACVLQQMSLSEGLRSFLQNLSYSSVSPADFFTSTT